ncbi:MAG: sensor histidine kinase [Minisyncoccales bacterium]
MLKLLTVLIENFIDGILVFDEQDKLLVINQSAENLLKVKGKKVKTKTITALSQYPNFSSLINLLKEEKPVIKKEISFNDLSLQVSIIPLKQKENNFGQLVILHDITQEKIKEKLKTEFVSLVAHQLRTPLSAIKWTLKLFLDNELGDLNNQQKDYLEKIYQANERMIVLIKDLLDVAKIEEGHYLEKSESVDLIKVIEAVIELYRKEIMKKRITLVFEKTKEPMPQIALDVEKIKLAIQNLLDNAVRYTPAGGKITIAVDLEKKKKQIVFMIKDTGQGIPFYQQNRVFTKFFRASNVIKLGIEGSGLGLFIVKSIIDFHKGKIWFKSEENKGTTFWFSLPLITKETD